MRDLSLCGSRIVSGPGCLEIIQKSEGKRFFIVTGRASMQPHIEKVTGWLDAAGKAWEVLFGIGGNPTTSEIEAGAAKMKAFGPDTVLAIGGGSAIDAAKVMTLLCDTPSLTIADIRAGRAPAKREHIAFIAAPSTSGTASEVTRTAVVTFEDENLKVGLKTLAFIPDMAILDAELTMSMPDHVMVETGMDALTHAIESYINKNNDDICKAISKASVEGLIQWLPESFEHKDIDSRQHVHNFQCYVGMAFQNSGLGMDHGISHAFGGRFGTSHGLLNAIGLPYVMRYNSRDTQVAADFATLSEAIGCDIIERVEALNEQFGVPKSLKAAGIPEDVFVAEYDALLANSMKGSTARNPVPMTEAAMDLVLKSMFYGEIRF